MRAVTSSQGSVNLVDINEPEGPGELITVTSSGICGSDLHLIKMGLSGIVLGHEFGGYTSTGQLVAVRPTGECGTCLQCVRGVPHTCRDAAGSLHGTSIHGGLAERVRVDASRLIAVPDGTDAASLALVEPLAVVIHGINRVALAPGMKVLIVGAGSIGLLTAAVLVIRGVTVHILCRHDHQIAAADSLGAHVISEPDSDYDFSFDAVCTQQSFDTCVTATRPRGSIVEFGMIWSPLSLNNTIMLKEISIVPSIFYSHDHLQNDFEDAVHLLHNHSHITDAVVTHRFALSDAVHAFDVASDKKSGAIKVHLFSSL
jgi:threonine dehydrogenase-like Zn-dependent dehydrogenase